MILPEVLAEAQRLWPLFTWAGTAHGFAPHLIAAIAIRESHCGLLLDANGCGDNGHGRGIMQVDDRSFAGLFNSRYPQWWKDEMWAIASGVIILDAKWSYLANATGLDGRELLYAAVAAYNCGEGNVGKIASRLKGLTVDSPDYWSIVDTYTWGHDYARNVYDLASALLQLIPA